MAALPFRAKVLALVALLSSTTAHAFAFEDSFETGGFSTWTTVWSPLAASPCAATSLGAHRGGFGFHLEDNEGAATSGTQCALSLDLPSLTGSFFWRAWVRVSPTTPGGSFSLLI